jgi:hypothetical protein
MKPYGWRKYEGDCCCPGHDKFPGDTYESKLSKRAQTRDTKIQHRVGRHRMKNNLIKELNQVELP